MNIITNSDATKVNILDAIDWLDEKEDKNDVSIFYYAGHGSGNIGETQYLHIYDSLLSDQELADKFDIQIK